jgi:ADP-heptose:LPS heptosyltransferase
MYRKDDKAQPQRHLNFLFDDLGLGDAIAALPALRYVYENYPHIFMHVWVPNYFLDFTIASMPVDKKRLWIKNFEEAKTKFDDKMTGRSFKLYNGCSLATHPTDVAFLGFINRIPDIKYKNYINFPLENPHYLLPDNYVVITTNFTANVRQFLPEHINKISDYCNSKGYTPVYLGRTHTETGVKHVIKGTLDKDIDFTKGVNLINKTSLLESREIISNAKAIVGLDNGLIHLAGTTDVPIVVGYTSVGPEIRMPIRHNTLGWNCFPVVPPESLECRFCQSNWNLTFQHDFKECFYNDLKCIKQLDAQLYIDQLEYIFQTDEEFAKSCHDAEKCL